MTTYSAEDLLVGAMLTDDMARLTVAEMGIGAEDFERRELRTLVDVVREMDDLGYPIEAVSIESHAMRHGHDAITGELVNDLRLLAVGQPQVVQSVRYYADIVAENARQRRAVAAAQKIIERMRMDPDLDVENELARAMMLAQKSPKASRGGWYSDLIPGFADRVQGNWDETLPEEWIATGYHNIDRLIRNGMRPGELIIIAARPGAGKTMLGVGIANNVARAGHRVAIFSAEMNATAILRRASAEFASMTSTLIDGRGDAGHPSLNLRREQYMHRLRNEMSRLQVYVDDTTAPTVGYIRDRIQRLGGVDLVIVDYLSLMGDSGAHTASQEQRTAEKSRGLAALAKDFDVPVIALSQLSRQVENRPPFIPVLSDLRDSGMVEADAHIVMLLYRRQYYVKLGRLEDDGEPDIMQVHIAKNREGETNIARLRFDGSTFTLSDM